MAETAIKRDTDRDKKNVNQWPLSWMTRSVPSRVLRAPLSKPWEAYLQSVSRGPV